MERKITPLNINDPKEMKEYKRLLCQAFGPTLEKEGEELYRWMLLENPYNPGKESTHYVMKEGDKIIAADGLFPHHVVIDGKVHPCAHSIRSMTDEDYQRQGIFRTMTNNSLDMAKKLGMDMVIGFANAASTPCYENFGWILSFKREIFQKRINIGPRLEQKVKSKFLSKIGAGLYSMYDSIRTPHSNWKKKLGATIKTYDAVPEAAQEIWEKYGPLYKVCTCRDYEYLNYRYNLKEKMVPEAPYVTALMEIDGKPEGYAIVRDTDIDGCKCLVVCELFTHPDKTEYIDALIEFVLDYAKQGGYYMIILSTSEFGSYKGEFVKYKFYTTVKPSTMVINLLNDNVSKEEVAGLTDWYYTHGDGEVEWMI